jgi:hypothetical protein
VNNQGQAVATEGALHEIVVYPIGSAGRLGKPWQVELPGDGGVGETSVTLGSHGKIAVGAVYGNGVAIASWTLGETPPMAQVFPLSPSVEAAGLSPLKAPLLVIGPSAVTALWTIGLPPQREETIYPPKEIEQAYGPFGSQLTSAQLFAAPQEVVDPYLSLEPNGDPVASWLDDGDKIRTVTGPRSGALQHSATAQEAPGLFDVGGFTSDYEGDTVFSYFSRVSKTAGELRYMTSHDGGPFTPPRDIALTGDELFDASVFAGGDRTLLAFWQCESPTRDCKERGKIGKVSGALSRSFTTYATPEAFISSSGRAVIIYHTECCGLYAVTAEPGRQFTSPRRFATRLPKGYAFGAGGDEEPPPSTSPNGHAILYFTNEENGRQYLVRYTP